LSRRERGSTVAAMPSGPDRGASRVAECNVRMAAGRPSAAAPSAYAAPR
jgi:hypothetical protein